MWSQLLAPGLLQKGDPFANMRTWLVAPTTSSPSGRGTKGAASEGGDGAGWACAACSRKVRSIECKTRIRVAVFGGHGCLIGIQTSFILGTLGGG
jgi:hypothetical protein